SFATAAIDAPHGVQEEDEEPPERDKLKAPFDELVVTGRRLMAARADRDRTLARACGNLDRIVISSMVGVVSGASYDRPDPRPLPDRSQARSGRHGRRVQSPRHPTRPAR